MAQAKWFDDGFASIGWKTVPAGENGTIGIGTDANGYFYYHITREDSNSEGRPALVPLTQVASPGLTTRQVCMNVRESGFQITEHYDGSIWDVDGNEGRKVGEPEWTDLDCDSGEVDYTKCYGAEVPENCMGDGYERATFYKVNAADYSNSGSVGMLCRGDKCDIIQNDALTCEDSRSEPYN